VKVAGSIPVVHIMKTDKYFIQKKRDKTSVLVRYLVTSLLEPKMAALKLCKEQSLSNALGDDVAIIKKHSAKYLPRPLRRADKPAKWFKYFETARAFFLFSCINAPMLIKFLGCRNAQNEV